MTDPQQARSTLQHAVEASTAIQDALKQAAAEQVAPRPEKQAQRQTQDQKGVADAGTAQR
jgi:hypothetical protein